MLPSSKFGGTYPPQGIFALQKSLRAGCDGGRGSSSQSRQSPRKEISRGNLLCAESGLPSLSYPRLQSVQKYVGTPNRYNRPYRAAWGARGAAPLCFRKSPEKTLPRVFFGQLLPGGSTRRFFAQRRSVGSNFTRLEGLCQSKLALAATDGKNKKHPWQALPELSFQPSQGFYKLRCCPAAAANEARAGFDKPLHMLRKLA